MHDPSNANHITWWPLYRENDLVHIHNNLLFIKDLNEKFAINNLYAYVVKRETVNEDGDKVSEWTIPLQDLKVFRDQLYTQFSLDRAIKSFGDKVIMGG